MIVAGIDIGSRSTQYVIFKDHKMIYFNIIETGPESVKTANLVISKALKETGLTLNDIDYIVATPSPNPSRQWRGRGLRA